MRFPFKQTATVYKYIRRQKKAGNTKFPIVLMLEPLHACNLTCSGCGRIREYKDSLSKMLSIEECLRAVDDSGAPVVSICGGEPLLYPGIGKLVRACVERGRVVYLCTNGQVLDKKLNLFTPSPLFNINIHLDGLAATHDAIVEKSGAFDHAIASIKAAKKAGFTICTNTTVYRQTDASEIRALVDFLTDIDVDGMLLSPSFDYTDAPNQNVFMSRGAIVEKFGKLRDLARHPKMWSTPLFMDYLAGKRDYPCTPWGNVTYNVAGWKAPCYLVTDSHYKTFGEFMNKTDWTNYGPGKDKRCANCMCHCGIEPTIALTAGSSLKDAAIMAWWTLK